jgi:hypothetical protein
VPHVTLSRDIADPAAALAALNTCRLPISGELDAAEIVRFRPVEVLATHRLKRA